MEQEKQRIIQEFVPGKQVTLAHVIANPDSSLYKKLGVIGDYTGARSHPVKVRLSVPSGDEGCQCGGCICGPFQRFSDYQRNGG